LRPRTPRQPSTTARWFVRSHCAARERAARPILSRVPHRPATSPAVWCTPPTQLSSWRRDGDGDGTAGSLGGDAAVPLTGGQDDGDASGASAPMVRASFQAILSAFFLATRHYCQLKAQSNGTARPAPSGPPSPPPRLTLPHGLPLPTGLISQSKPN